MTGELVEGKRTFIQRPGRDPFELPGQHRAERVELGSFRDCIRLESGQVGGTYRILSVDEEDDRVVVVVGDMMTSSGPATWGHTRPEVIGYPFPDEPQQ